MVMQLDLTLLAHEVSEIQKSNLAASHYLEKSKNSDISTTT